MNASTSGSASRNSLENRCDMQPLTINFWFVRLFKPRCWCASRIASIDSSLAESMNAQVLITRTSASSAREVISIPRASTLPSMISASTRFLAQPRLIIPTLVLIDTRFDNCGPKPLLDGDIVVVFGHDLAVLFDLNGVAIEHPNGDVLPAKFHRAVGR